MSEKKLKLEVSGEFLRGMNKVPTEVRGLAITAIEELMAGLNEGKTPEEMGHERVPDSEIDNLQMEVIDAEGFVEIDSPKKLKKMLKNK